MFPTTAVHGGDRRSSWIREPLQISTTVLLSLFLPLSFLLLSRISAAVRSRQFYADDFNYILLYNAAVLYLLLSFLAGAAFLRGVSGGRLNSIKLLLCRSPEISDRRSLSVVWIAICALVLFAELGVEFQLGGEPAREFQRSRGCSISRGLLFAIGLFETMIFWKESVVEPVVAAALGIEICGGGVAERIGLGLSFGGLWWWRLRDHVDSLAVVETPCDVMMTVAELVSVGLFYLTVITGTVRVFAGAAGTMQGCRRMGRRLRKISEPIDSPSLPF